MSLLWIQQLEWIKAERDAAQRAEALARGIKVTQEERDAALAKLAKVRELADNRIQLIEQSHVDSYDLGRAQFAKTILATLDSPFKRAPADRDDEIGELLVQLNDALTRLDKVREWAETEDSLSTKDHLALYAILNTPTPVEPAPSLAERLEAAFKEGWLDNSETSALLDAVRKLEVQAKELHKIEVEV